jgi:hypothetical protein
MLLWWDVVIAISISYSVKAHFKILKSSRCSYLSLEVSFFQKYLNSISRPSPFKRRQLQRKTYLLVDHSEEVAFSGLPPSHLPPPPLPHPGLYMPNTNCVRRTDCACVKHAIPAPSPSSFSCSTALVEEPPVWWSACVCVQWPGWPWILVRGGGVTAAVLCVLVNTLSP